jgi:hypothetical protein
MRTNRPSSPVGDNPAQASTRGLLRFFGVVVFATGVIFTAVCLINFFSAFGTMQPPRLFWCGFVGLPLMGLGGAMLQFGFMGAVSRYAANEVVPVASDSVKQVIGDSKELLQDIAHPAGDTQSRLEKLERLKDDGLITPAEYAAKRAEIIKAI